MTSRCQAGAYRVFVAGVTAALISACGGGGGGSGSGASGLACSENEPGNGSTIIDGPSGPQGSDYDQAFRSLSVHPADPNTVLLGTERNGFVRSTDGGTSWSRHRQGLRYSGDNYPEIWDIAYDPNDPSIVYAATLDSPGPVTGTYPSSIAGVYKSTDGGTTWARSNCGLVNSRAVSIAVSGTDSNVVVLGIEGGAATFSPLTGQYFNGGIFRSTDAGSNWSALSIDGNETTNGYWWLRAYGNSDQHFMTFGSDLDDQNNNLGFIKSENSGANWSGLGAAVKNLFIAGFAISMDGQTLYANERDSYEIRLSTNGGANWTTTSINQANGPVAVSPSDDQRVLYGGSSVLYLTTDGFATAPTTVLSAGDTITDIVFAPSDPTIAYAVARGYLVYKSTDSGASFSLVKNIRSEVLNN